MKTVEQLIDRFNNLLEVRSIQQSNVIQAGFDEDDLKSLIYHLGELKAIHDKNSTPIEDIKQEIPKLGLGIIGQSLVLECIDKHIKGESE